jgi:AcrR family transcriptional regulator
MRPLSGVNSNEPLRADGRANRARVQAAAREVYAEVGPGITTGAVAERADVSRATLYRTYPSRNAMLAEIVAEHLVEWCAMIEDVLRTTPPREPVFEPAMRRAYDGAIVTWEAITDLTDQVEEVRELKQRGNQLFVELVEEAIARGELASDSTPEELSVLFRALRHAIPEHKRGDPAIWTRYLHLVFNGLRP